MDSGPGYGLRARLWTQGQVNDGPRLVTAGIMVIMSTDGSGEEYPTPGPTLSYPIVGFHPFWPDCYILALNLEYRKEHLLLGMVQTAVPALR